MCSYQMALGTTKRLGKEDNEVPCQSRDKNVTRLSNYKYLGLLIDSPWTFKYTKEQAQGLDYLSVLTQVSPYPSDAWSNKLW